MTWIASPVSPDVTDANYLYEIGKRHRLIPETVIDPVDYYSRLSRDCAIIRVEDKETKEKIGEMIITDIIDNDSASLDFIPNPKYFAPGQEFHDRLFNAVNPILVKLMEGRHLRRITAMVPQSRCRTKKALKVCGFRVEGVMKDAVKFRGRKPENVTIMGILPEKE